MEQSIRFVGLDVHAKKIVVAVAEQGSAEPQLRGDIPNEPRAIEQLMRRLGPAESLRVCYEAGPCGFVIYRQLRRLGIQCEVIAPTLIPQRPGDRVKTDKRDAKKLARAYRNGDLTKVWVPDEATEALRELRRQRDNAKEFERRSRQQLSQFLLRRGVRAPEKAKRGTIAYAQWLEKLTMPDEGTQRTLRDLIDEVEHQRGRVAKLQQQLAEAMTKAPAELLELVAALQALRGIAWLSALTLALEIGSFSRFESPRELMAWAGMVPSEHSSGEGQRRGGITKTGNAFVRRTSVESAWCCTRPPKRSYELKKRREDLPSAVVDIALRAEDRLYGRFRRLVARGKERKRAIVAVGRELLGFAWAIAREIERRRATGESMPVAVAATKAAPTRRYRLKKVA